MDNLKLRYNKSNENLQQLIGKRKMLKDEHALQIKNRESSELKAIQYMEARKLLEMFIKSTEVSIKNYIEPLVNEALAFVFQQGLEFRLIFIERRNQIEVDFIVMREESQKETYQLYIKDPDTHKKGFDEVVKGTKDINYNYGGAVNQVLSLVLRLVLVELLNIKGTILLDEPTSACSEEYSARVGQLVSNFSYKFSRQYLIVTHSTSLSSYADKTYRVQKVNEIAQVSEVV